MYSIGDYLLSIKFGVVLGILVVGSACLTSIISDIFKVNNVDKKKTLSLILSPIYVIVYGISGITIIEWSGLAADRYGFLWIQAMIGFTFIILPANRFALLTHLKNWQILIYVGLTFILSIIYMVLYLFISQ
jgi:hypothetical protein